MNTKLLAIPLLLAGLLALPDRYAAAAVLGEVLSVSAIGDPFRVEIRSPGTQQATLGECIRIRAPAEAGDGIPAIRAGNLHIEGSGEGSRIVVSQSASVSEPVVRLALENICESRLRREYTLLLPYPAEIRPPLPSATAPDAPPSTVSRPRRPGADAPAATSRTWTSAPGESLESIALALYPKDGTARRNFIAGVMRDNPQLYPDRAAASAPLPPGTEFAVPDLNRITASPQAEPRRAQPSRVPTAADDGAPAPRAKARPPAAPAAESLSPGAQQRAPTADRLVLEGHEERSPGAGRAGAPASPDDAGLSVRERELAREERLVAALDRTINLQLELMERIRRLENIQSALNAQLEDAPTPARTPAPAEAPRAATAPTPPSSPNVSADIPEKETAPPRQDAAVTWWPYLAGVLGVLAIALLVLQRRRAAREADARMALAAAQADAAPAWPDEAPVDIGERAARRDEEDTITPAQDTGFGATLEWDLGSSALRPPAKLAPIVLVEETVEEHDSAIELAEIMMGFGRVQGAAETLAEFIRSNPKQAVTPWLKLLEVYRAAGLRAEFDALARQLNKTFNVKAVSWETFDEARHANNTVEEMPHVVDTMQKLWGTRDCQAYLQKLLRDNRDGTRQGFPLSVIDEILMLSAVLEQHLGPYRPTPLPPATESIDERKVA